MVIIKEYKASLFSMVSESMQHISVLWKIQLVILISSTLKHFGTGANALYMPFPKTKRVQLTYLVQFLNVKLSIVVHALNCHAIHISS